MKHDCAACPKHMLCRSNGSNPVKGSTASYLTLGKVNHKRRCRSLIVEVCGVASRVSCRQHVAYGPWRSTVARGECSDERSSSCVGHISHRRVQDNARQVAASTC